MHKHQNGENKSPWKVISGWVFLIGGLALLVTLSLLRNGSFSGNASPHPSVLTPNPIRAVIYWIGGGICFLGGCAIYLVAILTECFTFDYSRPVREPLRLKMFLTNIIVMIFWSFGIGFILSSFATPMLMQSGFNSSFASSGPIVGSVVVWTIVTAWFSIWTPLDRRLIQKRLQAQGIHPQQMAKGVLIGLSDPTQASTSKLGGIEDDLGMMWFEPDYLVFRGDKEHFAISREHLISVDRQMDASSVTVLSGTSHVILKVRLMDGRVRAIRLHVEGYWTLSSVAKAMEALANRITAWQSGVIG